MSIFDCGCEDKHGTKTEWAEDGQEPGGATEVKWGDIVHLCCQGA